MVARFIVLVVLILLSLILKTAVLSQIDINGVRPAIVALTVTAIGLNEGPDTGLKMGFGAGLLSDLLGGPSILVGSGALTFLCIGFCAGWAKRFISDNPEIGMLVVSFATSIISIVMPLTISKMMGTISLSIIDFLGLTFGTAIYSLVLAPLILWVVRAVLEPFPKTPIGQIPTS